VPHATVNVWSESRPWHGTYADIASDARRLAGFLAEAGLVPGDVVAFQLPNWREAVVAFYGLAIGGFVLVPIVHIYGHKTTSSASAWPGRSGRRRCGSCRTSRAPPRARSARWTSAVSCAVMPDVPSP
jgi:hypothetical protein